MNGKVCSLQKSGKFSDYGRARIVILGIYLLGHIARRMRK